MDLNGVMDSAVIVVLCTYDLLRPVWCECHHLLNWDSPLFYSQCCGPSMHYWWQINQSSDCRTEWYIGVMIAGTPVNYYFIQVHSRAWVIDSSSRHHGCPLMHVCNCLWLCCFLVDDVFLSMCNSVWTTTLKGLIVLGNVASVYSKNASYAQLPLLEWCNVHCYSFSSLLRTHGYLYVVQVITYHHCIVQVAIYSTP